jgi:Uma2 family endonuclease
MAEATKIRIITAEDVLNHENKLIEVVNGQWVEPPMTGERHGAAEVRLIVLFDSHVRPNKLGRVYPGDITFVLDGTPKRIRTMRKPDVAFVTAARVQTTSEFYYQSPDLAVEIVSPSERTSTTRAKLNDYLRFGTQQVWLVYPDTKQVEVYQADGTSITYSAGQSITVGELLPGFTVDAAAIFEE